MRLYTKMPLFNEIRSNVGLISLLSIILLLNICCDMQTPRKQNYGLNSSDDHFLYSYFLTNSELFVKTRSDFDKQFDTKEYKELQNQVETIYERSGRYIQAEPIYLPVVQKIIQGNKFVFIFETKEETMDGTLVKRIAFECKELKASIKFPDECVGYYMRDGWEWPPDIFQIVSGEVKLKDKSLVTGYLAGNLSLFFMDDVYQNKLINISGGYIIYDRNKSLFFSKPAHF